MSSHWIAAGTFDINASAPKTFAIDTWKFFYCHNGPYTTVEARNAHDTGSTNLPQPLAPPATLPTEEPQRPDIETIWQELLVQEVSAPAQSAQHVVHPTTSNLAPAPAPTARVTKEDLREDVDILLEEEFKFLIAQNLSQGVTVEINLEVTKKVTRTVTARVMRQVKKALTVEMNNFLKMTAAIIREERDKVAVNVKVKEKLQGGSVGGNSGNSMNSNNTEDARI
ncbi:hypothetical protein B0H65DRAFT_440884 [Neurospora tetraspora]|uniref:Uncharacterized protein n=1 Tax=Neurospora tetraspora TaxID=94610 RepID=A0AAE0JLU8_9PEZI|nr:hypothetical protein B0H65DRAFT_440884 [Neurospora tetraspora]